MYKKQLTTAALLFLVVSYFVFGVEYEKKPTVTTDWLEDKCLDKHCPGDVYPDYDKLHDTVLKIDGMFLVGPRKYFSTGINGMSFEWWEHGARDPEKPRPPEMQTLVVDGKGDDYSVRVFLKSSTILLKNGVKRKESAADYFVRASNEQRVIERTMIKSNLERWKLKRYPNSELSEFVYVTLRNQERDERYPVLFCINSIGTCTAGFFWKDRVHADLRFNAKNAPDWIEIFDEITRVMQLLRQAP